MEARYAFDPMARYVHVTTSDGQRVSIPMAPDGVEVVGYPAGVSDAGITMSSELHGAAHDGPDLVVGDTRKWPLDVKPVHRIIHAWHTPGDRLVALGSDGSVWQRGRDGAWYEIPSYPPGLEPIR